MRTLDVPPRVATLYQNGQHVSFDDDDMQALGDLKGCRLVPMDDPEHGYDLQPTWQSLLQAPDGKRIANAGLIPLLRRHALDRNVQLHLRQSPPICHLPDPAATSHLAFPRLIRFVRARERGMIRIPSRIAPEKVIHDLALGYPGSRIVVLGKHTGQLKRIYAQLASKIEGVQCVTADTPVIVEDDDEMPHVVLSTFVQAAEVDFAISDIVLLLDAYDCIHERAQLALSQIDARFRLFGLVQAARIPAPSQEDMAMGVFGPEILDIFRVGRSRREVNVIWVDNHHSRVSLAKTDRDYWRRCYWLNERRNRRIKQLASALASGTPLKPKQFGEVAEWFHGRNCEPQVVTILVDRPLHAVELSDLLPDWTVVTGEVPLNGLRGSFRNRVKQQHSQWDTGRKQIVLADAVRGFHADASDVVIWAGGGPHTDAIPGFWFGARDDSTKPLLIVDLFDGHNRNARKWSRERWRAYYQRDIFPLGISQTQGRIAMFLNRQPVESQR